MEPILSVKHLRRNHGGRGSVTHAMDDVNSSVEWGESAGITGTLGSGKSTLLNCIAIIDTPIAGYIRMKGQDVTAPKSRSFSRLWRERLGFVFQDCSLLDALIALKNIALTLTIRRTPAGEIGRRVEETAELLGITDCLSEYPYQMSGGQRQRTAAAQAIITGPVLMLADEPTGTLNSRSVKLLLDRFEALNREGRVAILMVTHDVFIASCCRRILFLQDDAVLAQLKRGGQSRQAFFQQTIGAMTRLGGDQSDVL